MNTQELSGLQDKMMAMEFAFICLAKALDQRGALPIPELAEHLRQGAAQLSVDSELGPVGEQLEKLRDSLAQSR